MNLKKIGLVLTGLLLLALAAYGSGMVKQPVVVVAQEPESNFCFSTHNSGAGLAAMNICISNHGNLVTFESPAGFHQISQFDTFRDGYAVCTGNLPDVPNVSHGWDAGGGGQEAGFGAPTIVQPNGPNTFPLTITRDTTNGVFRLAQKFVRDTTEKDVTITMTLTNLSNTDRAFVKLSRYFEGDVDNNTSADARFAANQDSVWEWVDTRTGHGLMLTALTYPPRTAGHATTVHSSAGFDRTGCIVFFGEVSTPTDPAATNAANLTGRTLYALGTIPAGKSKTVKVVYRRF